MPHLQPVTEPGRYPLQPLAQQLGCALSVNGRPRADDSSEPDRTHHLAELLGVTERTIRRYRNHGLTSRQADHYAIHLAHMHPCQLWAHWFNDEHIAADCTWPETTPT